MQIKYDKNPEYLIFGLEIKTDFCGINTIIV